jgi:hypothetical protein
LDVRAWTVTRNGEYSRGEVFRRQETRGYLFVDIHYAVLYLKDDAGRFAIR